MGILGSKKNPITALDAASCAWDAWGADVICLPVPVGTTRLGQKLPDQV